MDYTILNTNTNLVPENYMKLALEAQKSNQNRIKELLEKRKLPNKGWSDKPIEDLLHQISSLDTNNFPKNVGLGEREGRVISSLVAKRHYNFAHGIGRSGNLLESQPKAAGSTLLSNLTNELCLDFIKEMGIKKCQACFVVPVATGMALTLCFLSLKKQRPTAKYVLWSRIDQKSCLKSISAAGLKAIVIDPCLGDDKSLSTDLEAFENNLMKIPKTEILCIFSTTSCFAPRNCDSLKELSSMAEDYDIPHVINNAYGLQTTYLTHQISEAQKIGRIDLFVQSTDKNLMVPVGGAIIAGFNKETVQNVAQCYPGRASSSQSLDVFMTLMCLGKSGYLRLADERRLTFEYLKFNLFKFACEVDESVIPTNQNPISVALTLQNLAKKANKSLTEFGSMLYVRGISGIRVVVKGDTKTIDNIEFENWGSHCNKTNTSYMTIAAAIGIQKEEIDVFMKKLKSCWQDFLKK